MFIGRTIKYSLERAPLFLLRKWASLEGPLGDFMKLFSDRVNNVFPSTEC